MGTRAAARGTGGHHRHPAHCSAAPVVVAPLSATATEGGVGAALAHEAGTDNPPIDAALPTDPPIEPSEPPGTAAGRTASAALATPSPADLAAGIMPWAMPWMSLNEVVNSRVGEINRMNASKGVLASRVCDPVSPSSRSPSGPR